MVDKDLWIEIGTIVAPFGIKGELKVNPSTDFPERFERKGFRWLQYQNNSVPEAVQLIRGYQIAGKNLYVIQLAGVEDRNKAETLRGCKLLVPISDRLPLEEDEYHVADLIDLEVYNQPTQEIIGIVTEVFTAGNDLLEVKLNSGENKKVLIPFVKEIVPIVDIANKRLEINPPEGLLEIDYIRKSKKE